MARSSATTPYASSASSKILNDYVRVRMLISRGLLRAEKWRGSNSVIRWVKARLGRFTVKSRLLPQSTLSPLNLTRSRRAQLGDRGNRGREGNSAE